MFFFLLASICSLFSLVVALPFSPVMRDVWVPPITSPDANTVWVVGCNYTVTWDTSTQPSQVTNPLGQVYLRINNATQSTPLAQGFNLSDGYVEVTVPTDTQPSDQWMVVRKSILSLGPFRDNLAPPVFGDSGNWSPAFTITSQ